MIRLVSCKIIFTLGIVYSLAAAGAYGQTFTILHTFTGSPDAGYPVAGVVLDSRGNIYGATMFDGANQAGAVFRIDSDGNETVLHSFGASPGDGVFPEGGLVEDAKGNVYGTTGGGGTHGAGTVFKIDRKGQYSVLYSFKTTGGDATNPAAGLVLDKAGNLYGTSPSGGAAAAGAIFQISNTGQETVIYSFTGSPDGATSDADLVRDSSGNLYGTTMAGGAANLGTAFKLNPEHQDKVLFSFPGRRRGQNPTTALVRDATGDLYGTIGSYYLPPLYTTLFQGMIFRLNPSGAETVLYVFTGGDDGGSPHPTLVRDATGNLYGGTETGGTFGCGTVFKLDPGHHLTVLYSFTGGADGCGATNLTLDSRGNLYGMSGANGFSAPNHGTVFKITMP